MGSKAVKSIEKDSFVCYFDLSILILSFAMLVADIVLYDDLPLISLIADIAIADYVFLMYPNKIDGSLGAVIICYVMLLLLLAYYAIMVAVPEWRPDMLDWKPFVQGFLCLSALIPFFYFCLLDEMIVETHCRVFGMTLLLALGLLSVIIHFLPIGFGDHILSMILMLLVTMDLLLCSRNMFGYYPFMADSPFFNGSDAPVSRPMPDDPLSSDDKKKTLFDAVEGYMSVNKPYLNEDFELADLALSMFSNKTYLSKTINLMSGQNFRQYVNKYRVENAIRLMKEDPHMRMMEVSYLSGFHNSVTFNMAFKNITNQTPSDWYRDYRDSLKVAEKNSAKLMKIHRGDV